MKKTIKITLKTRSDILFETNIFSNVMVIIRQINNIFLA